MKIDLLHNKIIKDTATDAFVESFESQLLPRLKEKYSDELLAVQMYEDYLSDGFSADGRFYYPLTLVFEDGARREWISWSVENRRAFVAKIPFSYIGSSPLEFAVEDSVPEVFESKLVGRGIYFEGGYAPFDLEYDFPDKTFLSGRYSQRFLDEMCRQVSAKIEKAFSVSGIENGGLQLKMAFAPDTFMEHVVKESTYRRLLITARACSARDLWIKWKRLGSSSPVTISENIPEEELSFEICEDVPQKIREKEYRYLVSLSADDYQAAMGRKRITEWRDLVKRVIKRGELKRIDAIEEITLPKEELHVEMQAEPAVIEPDNEPVRDNDLITKLQRTLSDFSAPEANPVSKQTQDGDNGDITEMLKNLLGASNAPESIEENEEDAPPFDLSDSVTVTGDIFDSFADEDYTPTESREAESVDSYAVTEPAELPEASLFDENELRRRIEAEIREKLEAEAREKALAEAEELRRAHDALKAENERLAELARKAEEERAAKEAESLAEAERLRREIEARERAEAIEKARMAEAARLAVLEGERLERERAEEEARRKAEEAEAARMREAARIEEERLREAERIEAELARRAEAEATAKAAEVAANQAAADYKYTSKNVRLLFRRQIDPNITKRIHEIIFTTIKYFKKENVYIKIKASVPDSTTVNLHFVKIPEEESELLINIVKVLGKSDLGIIKAILE